MMAVIKNFKIKLINLVYYNKRINRFKGNLFQLTRKLTIAEEQVMQVVWDLKKASAKDIMAALPEPKPSCEAFLFIIRFLEKKRFLVSIYEKKWQYYYPVIPKQDYYMLCHKNAVSRFFSSFLHKTTRLFSKNRRTDIEKLERLLEQLKKI